VAEQPGGDPAVPDPAVPDPDPAAAPDPAVPDPDPADRRWSRPALTVLAGGATVLLLATAWHLVAVFLAVAPSNTLSQQYQTQINGYVYPEFEQNWQLFAPNPLQDNLAVEVRVAVPDRSGGQSASGWTDLTAQDLARIRGNPFPSHLDQNLLRRAWDYYTVWHSSTGGSSLGYGGPMSQQYLLRIAVQRLGRDWHGLPIDRIEFRSVSTPITGPAWTGAPATATATVSTLGWWTVSAADVQGLGPSGADR